MKERIKKWFFNLIKNPCFWAADAGALILLARLFGLNIDNSFIAGVVDALSAVLIIAGVAIAPAVCKIDAPQDKE